MASVSTYLNFQGNTEEAFNFYKSVFGSEFAGDGIMRFSSVPPQDGAPRMPEADKNLVMHVALPILNGHLLMGTDAPESMGKLTMGNNSYICLSLDTGAETRKLFDALAAGGKIETELQVMAWGWFGTCTDKFGVQWMFDCSEPA